MIGARPTGRSGRPARAGALALLSLAGVLVWLRGPTGWVEVAGLDGSLRVALAAIAATAVGWWAGRRTLVRDVRDLLDVTRRVAAGHPEARGDLRTGRDLVGRLGEALSDVARTLESGRSQREGAESAQRVVETRLAGFDVETDAIIAVSHLQRVVFFNRGAERIFGYPSAEIVGQSLDVLLPSEDATGTRRPHIRDLAGAGERRELCGRRRDGASFAAETSVSVRTRDGQTSYMVVVRDVTERKRAEAALRESEARFRGAFEHSAAGMALQGPDGSLVRVNRALCEMLGYTDAELLATRHQTLFHADDPQPDAWYERDLRVGSIRWYQREQRYRHKDGHVVWGLLSVSAVRDPDGRLTDFLIQVHDITERKRADALETQLRQAQKIEAVGRLAAGVAHDFNNLLMVITGRSHILLHRLPKDDPQRRHVELIRSTAVRAGALTGQLLAFSRKQALEPTVLDLNESVADLAPMLRRLVGEPIVVDTHLAAGLGRVKADRGQLEQVILNLSVNARDAMPQGGRLSLETANVELDDVFAAAHAGSRAGPHVAVRVRDTGIGMDAATRARLFEPFFTTKAPGKGTGLGLAIVYGIVKESGGYIDVESEPNRGATFTVYLPRVAEAPLPPPPRGAPGELPRGTETVLLVEDEEAVRDLAREILEQVGYTVLGARHGGEALLLGDRHGGPIHLIVTDVIMPEVGGPKLVERLAATRPGVKVLYMSGYTDEALEPYGVLGSATFLRKPFSPEVLVRKVREVLDDVRPPAAWIVAAPLDTGALRGSSKD